ncbi:uncharacterized protein LOC133921210 [Phragmites australis]|uniref:uncharacterized protein LOC133921210 n=1 Tax=Phragmites australis TaxID=29695 RepID=UPI002D77FA55|nr:uncharacterized protein LOC133921210 [Phragmites australis]
MGENTRGSGRRAFGDLTNVLCKRRAPTDFEMSSGGIKIRRIEKDVEPRKQSDENAKTSGGGKGIIFGNLFDGVAKENVERPSIFRGTKVQHMAAEAAGLLSKEASEARNHCASMDSSDLSDKDLESSLESGGGCEEDDDEIDGDLLSQFGSSELVSKIIATDGECLTQEEIVGSSGNQEPLSSLDFMIGGNMPNSNVQPASMRVGGLEEAVATKPCACSFYTKAAFMWTDLHYQDSRSRLSVLKKSIKLARSIEAKSRGNECAANAVKYNSRRAAEMEYGLSQQQRSLFLYTENVLIRESTQLHSAFVKLKELRENCKTDLEKISNSSLGK